MPNQHPLEGVEAYLFDVFGTVVDWHGSVVSALRACTEGVTAGDWDSFASEWRKGYYETTYALHNYMLKRPHSCPKSRRVAAGGEGSNNVDVMHREILNAMLQSSRWEYLAPLWDETQRQQLVLIWHRLNGWPDSTEGLHALKKNAIVSTLSNGNVRLLIDMAKYADLPWDVVLSSEMFSSYKPNPKVYLGAAGLLLLPPEKCALVAAHIYDLRAAASLGMKTVYVRRPTEDSEEMRAQVQSKQEGGEVDVVVNSLVELAALHK